MQVEIAEYTINNQMELILEDIYRRKPDMVGISCYIWNIAYALDLVRDIHKVLPDTDIWLGGPEVSYDAPQLLVREPEVFGVMKGEGEEMFAALLECYRTLGCTVRSLGWNEQKNAAAESVADSGLAAGTARTGQRLPGYRKYQATHGYQLSGTACPRWRV